MGRDHEKAGNPCHEAMVKYSFWAKVEGVVGCLLYEAILFFYRPSVMHTILTKSLPY